MMPLGALSYNHRLEVYYRLAESELGRNNQHIIYLTQHGLGPCIVLKYGTPEFVLKKIIQGLNVHGAGSGHNHMDFFSEACDLNSAWICAIEGTWLNSEHPNYEETRKTYMLQRANSADYRGFFQKWEPLQHALSLGNTLRLYKQEDRHCGWASSAVDFTAILGFLVQHYDVLSPQLAYTHSMLEGENSCGQAALRHLQISNGYGLSLRMGA